MLMGDANKAFAVMESWLKDNPRDKFIRRNLAIGYVGAGKREQAQKEFERLVSEGDRGAVFLSSLAKLYQQAKDPRAREYAAQAVRSNPSWSVAIDTYGWILVTEGEIEEGLKYLREAVSRDSNPLMRYHLAIALAELGRTSEAKIELQTILKTKNKGTVFDSAQRLYDRLNKG
jgi:Tfp pilus assembly protein PilF